MFCLLSLLLWIIYLLVQLQKWILFCKNIYVLLGKARITVILAFSLGTLLTISEICREVDALSCVPGFNCQWFFLFLPSEALALPYIFKHSMAAFLISSGPFASLCIFFTHFKQGKNLSKSRGSMEDHVVSANHISGAFASAGICIWAQVNFLGLPMFLNLLLRQLERKKKISLVLVSTESS